MQQPFYDPLKSYDENYADGPFGAFADGKVWKAKRKPAFSFFGLPVDLPFGIPAGPLLNSKFVNAALDKGFSIPMYKTVRSQEHPCHPLPNVIAVQTSKKLTLAEAQKGLTTKSSYDTPLSITNSFGVPSRQPKEWQPDLRRAVKHAHAGQVVIGSFQGTPRGGGEDELIQDCVATALLVKETGVSVIEQNLSCPNEGTGHLLCFDIERVEKITRAVKQAIGKTPLLLKLAYFQDQAQLAEFVARIGPIIDGLSAINTIPAKILDEHGGQALPGAGRAISGVCGDAVRHFGLEMTERLAALRQKNNFRFTLIGVGGVMKAEHFFQYRDAGADVVMSATGAMWNPLLAQEIMKGIT